MTDTTPGTDVAYLHSSLQERKEYAAALAAAGELVPSGFRDRNGAANPAKLLLAFETGASLGLHPLAALQGIHVIEGKPTLSAQLMSAIVRSHGHRLRVAATGTIEGNDYTVTATLIRKDDPAAPFTAVWTIDRARRAELFGKGTWRKYPENLLSARAISEVCRLGAADALSGIVYTPEEIGAEVNEDGDVIDGEIVEEGPETGTPGDSVKSKARLRDPAVTGPDAEPTRTGANRPGPSRPVTSPGTGRASAPEDRHAVADEWATRARNAATLTDARTLYREAHQRGILDYPLTSGELLEDVLRARGEQLADEEAHAAAEDMPPALDGIEDNA